MLRPSHVIVTSVLSAAACSPHAAPNGGGPAGPADTGSQTMTKPTPPSTPAKTTLELAQRAAAPGASVVSAGISVTGVDLFVESSPGPVPADGYSRGTLVGVVGGPGGKIVQGDDLVRAAISAKPDARTLAEIALWAARRQGEILDGPKNDEQRKAKVTAPAITGGALVFWVWTSGVYRMLQFARLDLATGALQLGPPPVSQDEAIGNAIGMLADPSPDTQAIGVKALADACGDPKAKQALLDALAHHANEDTRRQVAFALPACGEAAVQPLIQALEHDKSMLVRAQSASALGTIGDKRARPALEQAARSDSPGFAMAARDALKQLK